MNDCQKCSTNNYKTLYEESVVVFQKSLTKLLLMQYILIGVVVACLFITVGFGNKVLRFINNFEYVEETETEYHIEQDNRGHNTVVLQDGSEVNTNGSGSNNRGEEEKVLEKEEGNKVNSIIVNK